MIDWQMRSAGSDWQLAHEEIRAAFEDSGLVVYPRGQFPGLPPEEFMGVPTRQISSRVTGGGGGDPNAALYVMARLWPYVAAAGAGAIGADLWNLTKKGLRVPLERLLKGRAGTVAIQTVKDDDPHHDITFEFVEEDLSDIDQAVDELAAIVEREVAKAALGLDPGAWFQWDTTKRRWEPTSTRRTVPRRR